MAKLLQKPSSCSPSPTSEPMAAEVHPTAIVHPKARIDEGVSIGPYSVISERVKIGAGTRVGAHCVIEGRTTIGRECHIFTGKPSKEVAEGVRFIGEDARDVLPDDDAGRFSENNPQAWRSHPATLLAPPETRRSASPARGRQA